MPKKTHGLGTTKEYHIWYGMLERCRNPKSKSWKYYGEKGITVCTKWQTFENFIADMGMRPSADMSLDRIDGAKGYEAANCRWATELEQQRNRSFVKCNITMAAEIRAAMGLTHKQIAEMHGISPSNVSRIRSGAIWS